MESIEALKQIEYLKELARKTRIKAAYGYPYLILWGIITSIGYLCNIILPLYMATYHWNILWITGLIINCIIFLKNRNKYSSTPTLLKRIGLQCLILFVLDMFIFGLILHYKIYDIVNAYWPFQFGIIYIIASIHMSRDMTYIGSWLIITALASFMMPSFLQNIWLAITCGGGVFFSGILFRHQLKKAGKNAQNTD